MTQLEVHHIEGEYTEQNLNIYAERKTVTYYTKFPLEIDLKRFGTYTHICPICSRTFEIIVYPKLPLLKGLMIRLNSAVKSGKILFLFSFPLIFLAQTPLIRYLPDVIWFVFVLVAFFGTLGTLFKILDPGISRCYISEFIMNKRILWHRIYNNGKDIGIYTDSDMEYYKELKIYHTGS
ncbi:MAG: hypothetical protein Q7J35_14590 [Candidatus Methanoperedens sp.]|nr:hypothetical protein [Candidatus Methanoperedens sp.]